MANHSSAAKRNRQRIQRTARNRSLKTAVRHLVKKARVAISSHDPLKKEAALKAAIVALDKATTKGVLHRNTSSRLISRLSTQAALHKA